MHYLKGNIENMTQWKRDFMWAVSTIIVGVAGFIYAGTLKPGTVKYKVAQPGPYLQLWMAILGLLGVALLVKTLIKKPQEKMPVVFHKTAVFTLVSLFIYAWSMKYIGFVISTTLFTTAALWFYSWKAGKFNDAQGVLLKGKALVLRALLYVVIAVGLSLATYVLFRDVLGSNLPKFNLSQYIRL